MFTAWERFGLNIHKKEVSQFKFIKVKKLFLLSLVLYFPVFMR